MILDTSAIVAVLSHEEDAGDLLSRIDEAGYVGVGAGTVAEACLVLSAKLNQPAWPVLSRFLDEIEAQVIPLAREHMLFFQHAYFEYGKGRHPAGLNFGDCLSYAVARAQGEPLLFKGRDFTLTDVTPAR